MGTRPLKTLTARNAGAKAFRNEALMARDKPNTHTHTHFGILFNFATCFFAINNYNVIICMTALTNKYKNTNRCICISVSDKPVLLGKILPFITF